MEILVNLNESDNQNKLSNLVKPHEPDNLDDPNYPDTSEELDNPNKFGRESGKLSDYVHKDKLNNPDRPKKAGNPGTMDMRRVISDDEYKHVSIRNICMHLIDSDHSICSVLVIVIFIVITVIIVVLIIVIISIIIIIVIMYIIRTIRMCLYKHSFIFVIMFSMFVHLLILIYMHFIRAKIYVVVVKKRSLRRMIIVNAATAL